MYNPSSFKFCLSLVISAKWHIFEMVKAEIYSYVQNGTLDVLKTISNDEMLHCRFLIDITAKNLQPIPRSLRGCTYMFRQKTGHAISNLSRRPLKIGVKFALHDRTVKPMYMY